MLLKKVTKVKKKKGKQNAWRHRKKKHQSINMPNWDAILCIE